MKRRNRLFLYQDIFCYTAEEIQEYLTTRVAPEKRIRIFNHLQECTRCNSLFRDLNRLLATGQGLPEFPSELPTGPKEPFRPFQPLSSPASLRAGQIWTTIAHPTDCHGRETPCPYPTEPVMILWPGSGEKDILNLIRVIPITDRLNYIIPEEDLVLDQSSPLKYPIRVSVWNEGPMLAGNLDEYRGAVSEDDLLAIQRVRESLLSDTRKRRKSYDAELKRWRQLEMERTAYLSLPVNVSFAEDEETTRRGVIRPAHALSLAAIPVTVEFYAYGLTGKTKRKAGQRLQFHETELPTESKRLSAAIVQKRHELWLRLIAEDRESVSVFVGGEKQTLSSPKKGIPQECLLGDVKILPERLELRIIHCGEECAFLIRPREKEL